MIKFCCAVCMLVVLTHTAYSQSPDLTYRQQKTLAQVYNIGTSALISGVGAIITKKHGANWLGAFAKGFGYGAAGGYIKYQGKNILYNVSAKQNLGYNWLAKTVFSAGESITENAAANIKPWQRWYLPVYFTRLKFDFRPKQRVFSVLADPLQPIPVLVEFIKGRHLDMGLTAKAGIFIFDSRKELTVRGIKVDGYATSASVTYDSYGFAPDNPYRYHVFGHEMVHNLQYYDFTGFRGYLGNDINELESQNFISLYLNPAPYITDALYLIEGGYHKANPQQYYRNYFEFEAEFFSTRQKVNIY